jgi:hypothetical protein
MAYNTPPPVTTGQLATASDYNTYIKDSIIALRTGAIAIASQAANGIPYATSTTQFGILAAGASGSVLTSKGSGAAPVWGPSPVAMAIVFGGG